MSDFIQEGANGKGPRMTSNSAADRRSGGRKTGTKQRGPAAGGTNRQVTTEEEMDPATIAPTDEQKAKLAKTRRTLASEDVTAAQASLHPMAAPGESRAVMLGNFMQMLSMLHPEDLSHYYFDMLGQIGHEADAIAPNAAMMNQSTIMAKPSAALAEEIKEMFQGDELSEELKERAAVVFEAAVNSKIIVETARLQEELEEAHAVLQEQFTEALQEQSAAIFETVTDKLNQYLDYAINEWTNENRVAIERSIRTEIAEDFISNLHTLFAEHYINVPESKINVYEELKSENDILKDRLNESLTEKLQLEALINESIKHNTVDLVSEGLSLVQAEKLRSLAEGVEYSDPTTYRRKLEIIKENYFASRPPVRVPSSYLINEEIAFDNGTAEQQVPEHMSRYVKAISSTIK